MKDLTRAEIEAIRDAEDDTGDYMYRHGTKAGRAITQLLRQLDAANAQADASAEQMRERCKAKASEFDAKGFNKKYQTNHKRKTYNQYQAEALANRVMDIMAEDIDEALSALPLHEDK